MQRIVEEYYARYYDRVHGAGCAGGATRLLHEHLERPYGPGSHFSRVLELGAGDGQHRPFVRHGFDVYIETDLRPRAGDATATAVPTGVIPTEPGRYVSTLDAHRLPYPDASFDRVLAMCLLLHLERPAEALEEWRRVLRPGGRLDLLLPCEPGLLVRAYRALVTRRRAESLGCTTFDLVNALEHRNHTRGLIVIASHVLAEDDMRLEWRPFRGLPSWYLNTHAVLRAVRAGGPAR